jgi:hypothetical protein
MIKLPLKIKCLIIGHLIINFFIYLLVSASENTWNLFEYKAGEKIFLIGILFIISTGIVINEIYEYLSKNYD